MTLATEFEAIYTKVKRDLKEIDVDIQAGAHTSQYRIIEQIINDTAGYLVKLKTHRNSLVFINRLPVELLIRIILFTETNPRRYGALSTYVSYTWVCQHWRSVLVQTAEFWTSIRLRLESNHIHPFIHEVFKRSISAKLDLEIDIDSNRSISGLEDLFLKESGRIHTLRISAPGDIIEPMVKGKSFPSLRRLVWDDSGQNIGLGLLPLIIASDHLDALECGLKIPMDVLNQLTPVFTRLSKLILHINSTNTLKPVLDILHNSAELRSLRISTDIWSTSTATFPDRHWIILPELQFLSIQDISLLKDFQVPKLTSLDVKSYSLVTVDNPIHQKLHLSSIKYLQVCDWDSILGLTERIYPKSGFKDPLKEIRFIRDVDSIFYYNDICDPWPLNCFHLTFNASSLCIQTLQKGFLSRFTGLLELCLKSQNTYRKVGMEKILSQVPSLEKLIVPYGGSPMDFLRLFTDPSLCPRLSYVSYTASYPCRLEAEELENLAEGVGKLLTECVQSRQKIHSNALEYVTLRNCPPIPDNWLWELRKLGTMVVTAENVESIVTSTLESEDSSSSDND